MLADLARPVLAEVEVSHAARSDGTRPSAMWPAYLRSAFRAWSTGRRRARRATAPEHRAPEGRARPRARRCHCPGVVVERGDRYDLVHVCHDLGRGGTGTADHPDGHLGAADERHGGPPAQERADDAEACAEQDVAASVASTARTSITRASMGVGSFIRADRSITRLDAATVPSIVSGSSSRPAWSARAQRPGARCGRS